MSTENIDVKKLTLTIESGLKNVIKAINALISEIDELTSSKGGSKSPGTSTGSTCGATPVSTEE